MFEKPEISKLKTKNCLRKNHPTVGIGRNVANHDENRL